MIEERVPKRFRIPKVDPSVTDVTTIYQRRVPRGFVERVKEWIDRESARLVADITDDIRSEIVNVLKRGEEEGKSVAAIASSLLTTGLDKGVFRSARKRAWLIARTELHRARQRAAIDVFRALNLRTVKWIGIPGDGRICSRCLRMHGRHFSIDELEEGLLPPIHPRCRCRVLPSAIGLELKVKKGRRAKIIETKIKPTPKDYKYVVKLK